MKKKEYYDSIVDYFRRFPFSLFCFYFVVLERVREYTVPICSMKDEIRNCSDFSQFGVFFLSLFSEPFAFGSFGAFFFSPFAP